MILVAHIIQAIMEKKIPLNRTYADPCFVLPTPILNIYLLLASNTTKRKPEINDTLVASEKILS